MDKEQSTYSYRVFGFFISALVITIALVSLFFGASNEVSWGVGAWMLLLSIFLHPDDIKRALPRIKDMSSPDAYLIVIPWFVILGSYLLIVRFVRKFQES